MMMSTQTERILRASSVLERRLNRKSGTELIQGHISSRHSPKWQVKKGDMIFLASPLRRQTTSLGCSLVWPPRQDTWSIYQGYSGQPSSECWGSGSLEEHWVKLVKPDRFSEPPGLFALCAEVEAIVGQEVVHGFLRNDQQSAGWCFEGTMEEPRLGFRS